MPNPSACLGRSLLALLMIALAACGGGGGDSAGGGGGGGGGGNGEFTVKLDRSTLAFSYVQNANPTSQILTATWTGQVPPALYILAQDAASYLDTHIPIQISQTNATITVTPKAQLAAGTYSGNLIMSACADPQCVTQWGGSPATVSYTITVTAPVFSGPGAVNWQYAIGDTAPGPAITLAITNNGPWNATATASWMSLSAASGTGAGQLIVRPDGQGMAQGTYTGMVTVTNAAGTQTSSFTIVIAPPLAHITPASPLNFSGLNGMSPFPTSPISVSVTVDNGNAIPVTITSDPWIVVANVPATVPGSFSVNVDPSVGLASGSHTGNVYVTIGSGAATTAYGQVPVTLVLTRPNFSVSPGNVTLGGASGRIFGTIPLNLGLGTGSTAYNWSLGVSLPPWLQLNATSGTVSNAGLTLRLTPVPASAPAGTTTDSLPFTVVVNGDVLTQNVAITFNKDGHRLIASEPGVALVSTPAPGWNRLTHDVKIHSNFGLTIPWTATSDQPWLSVTASGTTAPGGHITLTADPSGVGAGGLVIANVTITSSDPSAPADEHIQVGFYKAVSAPTVAPAGILTIASSKAINASVMDPIRPYFYVHETNANYIRVFNVYNGDEYQGITNVPTNTVSLTMSTDGSTLYALGSNALDPNGPGNVIMPIIAGAIGNGGIPISIPAPPDGAAPLTSIRYARTDGVDLILDSSGRAFKVGSTSGQVGPALSGNYSVATDGSVAFSGNQRYLLDYTQAHSGQFTLTLYGANLTNPGFVYSTHVGAVTNVDGSEVCAGVTDSGAQKLACFDGTNMTDLFQVAAGTGYINNAAIGSDGRIYVGAAPLTSVDHDIWVYSADGSTLLANFRANPETTADGSLAVSGDGFIMALVYNTIGGSTAGVIIAPIGP